MLNSRFIQSIVVFAIVVFLAIWLGMALVTDQMETLLKIGGAALLITGAFLGQRIWLLLVFFTAANVVLYRWVGTTEMGQFLFIGFSGMMFLLRKLNFRIRFTELEFWGVLIIACIVQAYIRNPVGMSIFGSGNVGGRPYVALALGLSSSIILSTMVVPPRELKWAVTATLIGGSLGVPLQGMRYGDVLTASEDGSRIGAFNSFPQILARWLSSVISPLRACVYPLWGIVLLASLAMAAASGFRNAVAAVGLIYLVGIIYRGGFGPFLASVAMAACGLGILALVNLNFPLPGNIQRALSPFPGTWEERYRQAADRSTEWRVEMWKEALTSERWIQNKILGDGIGMTAAQLQQNVTMEASKATTRSGLLLQQENMLINGSYHSGPVHSIRMVGYVGLLILLLAMIRLAVHAHREIMRARGTEWYPVALFFGIPLITYPIFFVFVFGEYHVAVAATFFGMANIRLLQRNLPLPAWKKPVYQPYVLRSNRNTLPSRSARSA